MNFWDLFKKVQSFSVTELLPLIRQALQREKKEKKAIYFKHLTWVTRILNPKSVILKKNSLK